MVDALQTRYGQLNEQLQRAEADAQAATIAANAATVNANATTAASIAV